MKRIASFYFSKLMASIVEHLWRGIWTAIGFIMLMKLTELYIFVGN